MRLQILRNITELNRTRSALFERSFEAIIFYKETDYISLNIVQWKMVVGALCVFFFALYLSIYLYFNIFNQFALCQSSIIWENVIGEIKSRICFFSPNVIHKSKICIHNNLQSILWIIITTMKQSSYKIKSSHFKILFIEKVLMSSIDN